MGNDERILANGTGRTFTAEVRVFSARERRVVATYTVTFDTELPLIESLRRDPRFRNLISRDQDYILPFSINPDGSYSSQRDPRLGTLSYIREANNRVISSAVANGNNITELGLGNMTGQALNGGQRGLDIVGEAFSCSDIEASDLQAQQDGTFSILSQPDRPTPVLSYSSTAVTGRIYASDETIQISISLDSVFDSTARHINEMSRAVTRAAVSFIQESFFEPLLQRSLYLPFNLRQLSELELSRRQRLFSQSEDRRMQKMFLFDAAAPSMRLNLKSEPVQAYAQPQQDATISFFADYSNFQYDVTAAIEAPQINSNTDSRNSVSNPNTRRNVSNANNATVQTPASNTISSAVKNSSSIKTGARTKSTNAQEARARAANSASNFQIQTPISEGKTQVLNADTAIHAPVQNMQNISAAQKSQSRTFNVQSQSVANAQTQTQSMQTSAQQATQHEAQAQSQATQTQSLQTESMQTIAQTQEQQVQQSTAQQEHVSTTMHQEQVAQSIVQEPQVQIPIAVQRIRTEKKKAGEKIIPRIPIAVCANADKGNKKDNSSNATNEEKEKNVPVAQAIQFVPRRVVPSILSLIPLRNLFENNKRNKKEKHECASKVCGWCGRKAA